MLKTGENGDYTVVVTNEFNCRDTSEAYFYDDIVTSLKTNVSDAISVYPNPVTNGVMMVSFEGQPVEGEIRLMGTDGKMYYQETGMFSGVNMISAKALNEGIYYMMIISGGERTTTSVRVQ